ERQDLILDGRKVRLRLDVWVGHERLLSGELSRLAVRPTASPAVIAATNPSGVARVRGPRRKPGGDVAEPELGWHAVRRTQVGAIAGRAGVTTGFGPDRVEILVGFVGLIDLDAALGVDRFQFGAIHRNGLVERRFVLRRGFVLRSRPALLSRLEFGLAVLLGF